jgi:hypothetical protein
MEVDQFPEPLFFYRCNLLMKTFPVPITNRAFRLNFEQPIYSLFIDFEIESARDVAA